jgi:F-type H+-transporting ATPase subunit a
MAAVHSISAHAEALFKIGPLPVTNSMVVTWIVTIGLVLLVRAASKNMKLVPTGAQNFVEFLVESIYEMLEGIIGHQFIKRTFPFLATVLIFIAACNLTGLIPGFGTVGWGHMADHGFEVTRPVLRPANADVNMTAAMSATFLVLFCVWYYQAQGFFGALGHLFAPKGGVIPKSGILRYIVGFPLVTIFIFVGLLEVISIFLVRPFGLSIRLFGNIYAGDNLLEAMNHILPAPWSAIAMLPFYFLELLVAVVQAMVFMLLCAAFTAAAVMHEEEGH